MSLILSMLFLFDCLQQILSMVSIIILIVTLLTSYSFLLSLPYWAVLRVWICTRNPDCRPLIIEEVPAVNITALYLATQYLPTWLPRSKVQETLLSIVEGLKLFLGRCFLVYLSKSPCFFYKCPVGPFHVTKVLDVISDSGSYAEIASSKIYFIRNCEDIARTMARSIGSSNQVKTDTAPLPFCILVQHNSAFKRICCTFYFLFQLVTSLCASSS